MTDASGLSIAVLMTTFNRKDKTLSCLRSLREQQLPEGYQLLVFQTDDASSDGTVEAVRKNYPEVNVLCGSGNLFWAGGMRYTWTYARKFSPDYYLLVNDDTDLSRDAIMTLVSTSLQGGGSKPGLSIGSTRDQNTGQISYGGWKLKGTKKWSSERIHPKENQFEACDFGNANILLVPAQVVEEIGILASHFTHSLADYDYTLRARQSGFPIRVAPGFLGTCVDDHGRNWKSKGTTLRERIAYLKSPKGLAYKEYLLFIKEHFPKSYPSAFAKLWLKTFFPFIWDRFKK